MASKTNLMRADRVGYMVGGIALIVWALRRPSWARAGAAGMGSWLLYQAYTGRNPMFKPLGIRVNPTPAEADAAETIVRRGSDHHLAAARRRCTRFFSAARTCRCSPKRRCRSRAKYRNAELAWRATRADRLEHFGSPRSARCAGRPRHDREHSARVRALRRLARRGDLAPHGALAAARAGRQAAPRARAARSRRDSHHRRPAHRRRER